MARRASSSTASSSARLAVPPRPLTCAQVVGAGMQQAGQAAEGVEQLLRQLRTRPCRPAGAQQQRQQLGVAERQPAPRASSFSRGRASAGRSLRAIAALAAWAPGTF
jgi:hypothetical protein